jgi:hypothetical protein
MSCEPRWGDGLSTSNSARVERLSPRPGTHLAMRADPPPRGAGETIARRETGPYCFPRPRIITNTAAVSSTAMQP